MSRIGSRTACAGIILVTVVSILCTPIGESVQLRSGYSVRASVSASAGSRDVTAVKARLEANWGQLPLRFEAIRSQVSSTEEFVARAQGYEVLLNGSEAILSVERPAASSPPLQSRQVARSRVGRHQRTERIAVRMQIVGANPAPRAEGLKRLESRSNYLVGSDPSKWLKNVPSYGQVRFQEVYPGIDLVYYGTERRLEYDFVLSPARDPRIIRLRYPAAKSIHVDREGALVLRFDGTEIRQLKPNAYQTVAGAKRSVDARYVLRGDEVRFALGPYDPSQPLVIDPVLVYSTYFGGMGDEAAYGIAVDGGGNVYLTGTTTSTNLPTMGHAFPPFQSFLNGASGDVFVVKLNNTASSVIYATYIGGTAYDKGAAIAVDGAGNAHVGGTTSSSDFPTTTGASQPTYNGMVSTSNGFLLKLDPNGANLIYSTFLGGAGPDGVNNIFVDNSGIVFATGFTNSDSVFNPPGFPTTAGALQQNFGGSGDAFITKLSGRAVFQPGKRVRFQHPGVVHARDRLLARRHVVGPASGWPQHAAAIAWRWLSVRAEHRRLGHENLSNGS